MARGPSKSIGAQRSNLRPDGTPSYGDGFSEDGYFGYARKPGPLALTVGARVCYTRYFLRQMGDGPTSDAARRQGVVTEVNPPNTTLPHMVRVRWDDREDSVLISTTCLGNLAQANSPRWCDG